VFPSLCNRSARNVADSRPREEYQKVKRVVALVGPKGAGKSTIGALLEERLGLRFVRVEPLFLALREALGPAHPDFERRGFEAFLERLTAELALADTICFESTGASGHLAWVLAELRRRATVLVVQVLAERRQCIQRILHRDASIHIPVSDDEVERVNALAFQVDLPWATRIDNRGPLDPELITEVIRQLLDGPAATRPQP
jgi:cytidylate kinase